MTTVKVKRNDVGRKFSEPVTITGLSADPGAPDSALFLMKQGASLVSLSATVGTSSYSGGTLTVPLSYTSAEGELNLALGDWKQEWEMTWSGGTVLTAPTDGWNWVVIVEDLNPA